MSENEWTNFSKGLSTERIVCGTCDIKGKQISTLQATNDRYRELLGDCVAEFATVCGTSYNEHKLIKRITAALAP